MADQTPSYCFTIQFPLPGLNNCDPGNATRYIAGAIAETVTPKDWAKDCREVRDGSFLIKSGQLSVVLTLLSDSKEREDVKPLLWSLELFSGKDSSDILRRHAEAILYVLQEFRVPVA